MSRKKRETKSRFEKGPIWDTEVSTLILGGVN